MQVFCIQKLRTRSSGHENNMPAFSGMLVRYIRPRSREASSRASSTSTAGAPGASVKVTRPIGSVRLPVGSLGHCVAELATGAVANGTVHTLPGLGEAVAA